VKILVLSLLRIGDFFQHLRLIDDLRRKYPNRQIDILVNEGLPIPDSLKADYNFIFFPRQKIQQSLVSSQEHSLKALQTLEKFLSAVRNQSYDKVVDLTHTKLSYKVFRSLAGWGDWGQNPLFHHFLNETINKSVFKRSLVQTIGDWQGLQVRSRREHSGRQKPPQAVLFQVSTSDPKKDWPLTNWKWIAEKLTRMNIAWQVICAPFEVQKLLGHFSVNQIWTCGFDQLAENFLQGEHLLVSGDTSVLHWASVFEAPTLGLYVGSANVFETYPMTEGARILSPKTKCWPCRHSQGCTQSDFFCHQDIPRGQVLMQILQMLEIKALAAVENCENTANVWQVEKSKQGMTYNLRLVSGGIYEQQIQVAKDLMEMKLADLSSERPDFSLDLQLVPIGLRRTFAEVLHQVIDRSGRSGAELDKIKEFAASSS
jgi:ADP-heptose:LPS heptosyltransferase